MTLSYSRRSRLLGAAVAALCLGCTDRRDAQTAIAAGNQAPLGAIEEPADGQRVGLTFKVVGWAGDDRGIRMIRVSIDGRLAAVGSFTLNRPDVTKAYAHLRHGTDRHGWETTIDMSAPGSYALSVQAVDTDGISTELGVHRVNVSAR
jgi:hypothetical protein